MDNNLLSTLKKLRLSGLANTLEIRLHEAATTGLTHREFLELLLQDELLLRNDRLISRRIAMAGYYEVLGLQVAWPLFSAILFLHDKLLVVCLCEGTELLLAIDNKDG